MLTFQCVLRRYSIVSSVGVRCSHQQRWLWWLPLASDCAIDFVCQSTSVVCSISSANKRYLNCISTCHTWVWALGARITHGMHIEQSMDFLSHQFSARRCPAASKINVLFDWRVCIYRFIILIIMIFCLMPNVLGCERTRLIFNAVRNLCFCSSWLRSDRFRNEAFVFGTRKTCWLRCDTPPPTFCIIVKRSFIDSVVAWILSIDDMIAVPFRSFLPSLFHFFQLGSVPFSCTSLRICCYFYARNSRMTSTCVCVRAFVTCAWGRNGRHKFFNWNAAQLSSLHF